MEERLVPEERTKKHWSEETVGLCCTLCSAASYTVSLSLLRGLTNHPEISPDWSVAVKEATTVLCVLPIIAVMWFRGKYKFPGWRVFWLLVVAGFFCQALGARPHLIAYSAIGLALATPLIQAAQLIVSSVVGSVWLKERVTKSKIFAMILLVVAVSLLGMKGDSDEVAGKIMRPGLGVACAFCTAIGYSVELAIMRRYLRSEEPDERAKSAGDASAPLPAPIRTPTSLVMVVITGMGVLTCGGLLTATKGPSVWLVHDPTCWGYALGAGVANMCGFFFQVEGLRHLYVLKLTLIAAIQTAALCLLGLVLFGEPFNWTTILGMLLVLAGVFVSSLSK